MLFAYFAHYMSAIRDAVCCSHRSDFAAIDKIAEQEAMAVLRVFATMAQQRHVLAPGEVLDETECELLPRIADDRVLRFACIRTQYLRAIAPRPLAPVCFVNRLEQALARAETRHPNVIAIGRHPVAPVARDENPQAIGLLNRRVNGFGFQHGVRLNIPFGWNLNSKKNPRIRRCLPTLPTSLRDHLNYVDEILARERFQVTD